MRFDSYHPMINFMFFFAVIVSALTFDHPVFLLISYLCSFIYSIYLNGARNVLFNIVLIPLMIIWMFYYASYNHFGVTNLTVNFIGNQITLESLVYGLIIGVKASSVLMWFSCIHSVLSSDKIIYLFGKITPTISLFLSILLRMIPHIKEKVRKIQIAQKGIGRGINQGNILCRIRNFMRIISIVVTWLIEDTVQKSDSMRSRGFGLKGRSTFSIYRFDNRDRSFVITLFYCFTILFMGVLLDQTSILYNPEIIMNRVTPLSFCFYTIYGFLCLLPMILQIIGERKFYYSQINMYKEII